MSNKITIGYETKAAEITIELPYYCEGNGSKIKVISERSCLIVSGNYQVNQSECVHIYIANTTPCTREEFMISYREALENIEKLVKQ
jgi:hypothetical protein